MTNADSKRFAELMAILNEVYGDTAKPLTTLKLEIYWKSLGDLNISQVDDAVGKLLSTKTIKTFPLPGEIREAAQGKAEDKAIQAVDKIEQTLRDIDGYDTVVFDDPVIHIIIHNYGGWIKLTDVVHDDNDQWIWIRKDFIKAYQVYGGRPIPDNVPVQLTGIHDQNNAVKAIDHKREVVYVGDRQAALSWTEKISIGRGNVNSSVRALAQGIGG